MDFANVSEVKALVTNIIAEAKKLGATDAEVALNIDKGFAINVRKKEIETVEHHKGKSLTITVFFGFRSGSATTSDLHPEAINTVLNKACHIAKFTEEDPYIGLAEKELTAYDYPDVDLYHPGPLKLKKQLILLKIANQKL
jgi:PmbA protein